MEKARTRIEGSLVNLKGARRAVATTRRAHAEALVTLENILEAQKIIQTVAAGVQEQAHLRIAGVVTRCLQAVFDEPYEFVIKFEQKRGKTEPLLLFRRDGIEVDPMTAAGGGVVDVAAFALRLACLVLTRPGLQRVMVLDEPFRFVSANYRERVRLMLQQLSEEMKVQFVIVTHIDELQIGTVVEF